MVAKKIVAKEGGCRGGQFLSKLLASAVAMENGCYEEWLLRRMVAKKIVAKEGGC